MTDDDPAPAARKAFTLTSFILGTASIVLSWAGIGIVLGLAGIVFSIVSRRRERLAPQWMKTLGLGFSIIGLLLSLVLTAAFIAIAIALRSLGAYS